MLYKFFLLCVLSDGEDCIQNVDEAEIDEVYEVYELDGHDVEAYRGLPLEFVREADRIIDRSTITPLNAKDCFCLLKNGLNWTDDDVKLHCPELFD